MRDHVRHDLARRESAILFLGFEAAGPLGRALVDRSGRVRISERDLAVRAPDRQLLRPRPPR